MMLRRPLVIAARLLAATPALAQVHGGGANTSGTNVVLPNFRENLLAVPHLATNAALAAADNAHYRSGVWRDHVFAGGFADGPLFFTPQTGTCAANGWVNDGGNCVDSTSGDGNSWKALHQNNILNVKEFGCLGDNSTDNTTCIQNTINAAALSGGGGQPAQDFIAIPSGNYCIRTAGGVTATAIGLTIQGYGNVNLEICGANDSTLLTLNGAREHLFGVNLQGYNSPTVSAGHNALTLGASCVECVVESPTIQYGYYAIQNNAPDGVVRFTKALQAYGPAIHFGAAGFLIRDKFDQSYPTNVPPAGNPTLAAWAASTGYGANALVTIGSPSWILQNTGGACTSGSTTPVVAAYGTNISDGAGGCTWQLAAPFTYYALEITTGPSFVDKLDATGVYSYSVSLDNGGSGNGPQQVVLRDGNYGIPLNGGVRLANGQAAFIEGGFATNCVLAGCKGVQVMSTWGGPTHIGDGFLAYGNPIDVSLEGSAGASAGAVINGASLHGASVACVNVSAGVVGFQITGNDFSTGQTWGTCTIGVNVASGASDHYGIKSNILTGATTTVSDGGTGQDKTVETGE